MDNVKKIRLHANGIGEAINANGDYQVFQWHQAVKDYLVAVKVIDKDNLKDVLWDFPHAEGMENLAMVHQDKFIFLTS
jgi:hypothetical protein